MQASLEKIYLNRRSGFAVNGLMRLEAACNKPGASAGGATSRCSIRKRPGNAGCAKDATGSVLPVIWLFL